MPERASLEELREFCNTVRNAGGANPLDALLNAVPEEPNECLIARNLNFSCEVNGVSGNGYSKEVLDRLGVDSSPWAMIVTDEGLAKKISSAIDSEYKTVESALDEFSYQILLPSKIGEVASQFDYTYQEAYGPQLFNDDNEEIDTELLALIDEFNKTNLAEGIIECIQYEEYNPHDLNPEIQAIVADNLKELGFDEIVKQYDNAESEDRELALA